MDTPHNDLAHHALVDAQFGPQAQAYVASAVHAAGADLDALEAVVAALRPDRAIDIGCGGGHAAYRLASHAGQVTATDLSAEMVAAVARTAADKGLRNVETVQSPAERLPFEDGLFDVVASRFSAHHWRGFEAGLREARRVARPNATAVFIDAVSPGRSGLLDTHLQAVELLRDPSHVRDYTLDEWSSALARAGFAVTAARTFRLRMDYEVWVDRMRTPPAHRAAIRSLQALAARDVQDHFAIEPDGSFMLDTAMFEAVAVAD